MSEEVSGLVRYGFLMTRHDRARTAQSFNPLLNTLAIPCATITAQHHRLILILTAQRFSERLSSNKRV